MALIEVFAVLTTAANVKLHIIPAAAEFDSRVQQLNYGKIRYAPYRDAL